MNAIVNWVQNVSYDFVAIVLPGFTFLILCAGVTYLRAPALIGNVDMFQQYHDALIAQALVFAIMSYVAGQLLKVVSGLPPLRQFFTNDLKSHALREDIYKQAVSRLNRHLGEEGTITEWREFYLIAKLRIQGSREPSNLITYQNRYDLQRGLSTGFILAALLALSLDIGAEGSCVSLVAPLTCLVFGALLRSSFRKYWILFGDHVIAETLLIDSSEKKAEGQERG